MKEQRTERKERDRNLFFDRADLAETEGIRERCSRGYVAEHLRKRFPGEEIEIVSVMRNETGKYVNKSKGILGRLLPMHHVEGLPAYCEVRIRHCTGRHQEHIIIWVPLAWNDRFLGTGGGGTSTGGDGYLTRPDNTSRGLTLPKAVLNGFAAATTDGGASTKEWGLDRKTGKTDWELIENWRARSTHTMTVLGKAVAEILHGRPVRFAYFHGGSGGGRQAMVEAQEFPEDYNGVWASCPAMNWTKFLPLGFWANAVMNSRKHVLTADKIWYFMKAAQDSVGGSEAYYRYEGKVEFDPLNLVGQKTEKSVISKEDAEVMELLWQGPRRKNGARMWYYFRPGVMFWNVNIPVGAFYYSLFGKKPRPFFLSTYYARWVTEQPKQRFTNITIEEFQKLFEASVTKFAAAAADQADLTAFAGKGGRLILDHGIDDPLIPVDGTLDYYEKVLEACGGQEKADGFLRLYITPGDGHGTCNWHGPGITESDGMRALMKWVEEGEAPGAIRTVQVDKKGDILREHRQEPYGKRR